MIEGYRSWFEEELGLENVYFVPPVGE